MLQAVEATVGMESQNGMENQAEQKLRTVVKITGEDNEEVVVMPEEAVQHVLTEADSVCSWPSFPSEVAAWLAGAKDCFNGVSISQEQVYA